MSMSHTEESHALIIGASGIIGWAIVDELLKRYPAEDAFSTVTAVTNRPLDNTSTLWPESNKLQLVDGIDLLHGSQDELQQDLERIPNISIVTHVYFCAYIADLRNPEKEVEINTEILERGVQAIEHLSPKLKFVFLPTGLKWYGIHIIDQYPFHSMPLVETLSRIPEPYASRLFYYSQVDVLTQLAVGKKWTWCSVMPDAIIGFVPNDNQNSIAQPVARFLSLVRETEGEKSTVAFPGTVECWNTASHDASQDIIARSAIHLSLTPDVSGGQIFNIADNAKPITWKQKWPIICDWFNLKGVAPGEASTRDVNIYLAEHDAEMTAMESKYGLRKPKAGHEHIVLGFMQYLTRDRPVSLEKCHTAWGERKEETDVRVSWFTAFERMRAAKLIP